MLKFSYARATGAAALFAFLSLSATQAQACACGCGIFDVGGVSNLMTDCSETPYSVFFRYAYMNQNTNWRGSGKAPAADNGDQNINTSFYFFGGDARVAPNWAVHVEVPVFARHLTTTDDSQGTVTGTPDAIYTGKLVSFGDTMVMGTYTGMQPNAQTGISFGITLPTGDYKGPAGRAGGLAFDRDSLPGTGSTDLLFGGDHHGALTEDGLTGYYVNVLTKFAVMPHDAYRPGDEVDAAAGVDYAFNMETGPITRLTPVLSLLGSIREHDTGSASDTLNSGYERVLLAPGLETRFGHFRVYGDLEYPIYQRTNTAPVSNVAWGSYGQLVASPLFKLQMNYDF
jgi:hypothetical protein